MPNHSPKSIRKKFSDQLGIIPIPLIIGAILIITAAAASIPATYIINQTSQDSRSQATDNCCGSDGRVCTTDAEWVAGYYACQRGECSACSNGSNPTPTNTNDGITCKETAFCGGCIQANRCVYYSDGTKKYCNQWIDQECQQTDCCGNGVFCSSGQSCCQGLIKCPNGRCGTTCQAPTSSPTPTNTPIPSGTQCSDNEKECVNSISFKTCTNGYWSNPISCSSLDQTKPKCVNGSCVSANASDGRKTNLASCTTLCTDVDNCICKANNCVTPVDEIVTNGNTCGVRPTPNPTPACVSPNNLVDPNTQTCCSGVAMQIPTWGPGYYCIESNPPPPTSSPSPISTPRYTSTPTASNTPSPSPTATWTPISTPTRTPSPPATLTSTPIRTPSPSIPTTTTTTPTPSPTNCTPDGGYYYATTICCSGQHHTDFSGLEICGSSPTPTLTPAPTPAVISAIQQATQAIATTVTQVATTIWNRITGRDQTTSTPTPSPTASPTSSPNPSPTATAAPPPPTATPTFTLTPSPTARPTFTPTPTPAPTTTNLTSTVILPSDLTNYCQLRSMSLNDQTPIPACTDGSANYPIDLNSICQQLTQNPNSTAIPFNNNRHFCSN